MDTQKKITATNMLMVVCLITIIIHAIFILNEKRGLFLDETCTFLFANNKVVSVEKIIDSIKNGYSEQVAEGYSWLSSAEVLDKYTTLESGKFNLLSVYVVQAFDVHPPLYYFVINLVSSIFPKLSLFVVGGAVNIFFLILTCMLIYYISMEILGNKLSSIAAMMYYGLSFDFANSVTFFRMYAMLTFWGMLLLFLYIKWYQSGYDLGNSMLRKICLVEFAAMFTQYFALFFIFPLFVVTVYLMVRNKIPVKTYLIKTVITGIVYVVIWPFFFIHVIFSNRGNDVRGNLLSGGMIKKILGFKSWVCRSLFANELKLMVAIVLLVVIVLGIEFFLSLKHKRLGEELSSAGFNVFLYAAAMSIFYFMVASISAPWHTDRYIMPVMPVLSILITCFVQKLVTLVLKNKAVSGALIIAMSAILCFLWHKNLEPYYLYNSQERIAYTEKCSDLDAIVIDNYLDNRFSDVEINYLHPNVLELDVNDINEVGNYIDPSKEYYVYLRKEIDISGDINDIFDELGYQIETEVFESDCYEIIHAYKIVS